MSATDAQKAAAKRYNEKHKDDPIYKRKKAEQLRRWREKQKYEIAEKRLLEKEKAKAEISNNFDAPPTDAWHSPSVTIVLAESRKLDRGCIIETRKGSDTYRMKIVVIGSDVSSLKECARRVGFYVFQDTPPTIK